MFFLGGFFMYINSKHLQILKVIKNTTVLNVKDMSDIFSFSYQHTKTYVEDIYSELFHEMPQDLKIEIIIEKIRLFSNAKIILKNKQQFTKSQNIFYLIFHLIKNGHIKLSHICEELNLTKRNLNNYLSEISTIFSHYNLKIKISNKGVKLLGSQYSIKNFKYMLIFKFLIEKDFLPKQLRNELVHFIKVTDFYRVRKDIATFFNFISCDFINHSEIVLMSFYCSFIDDHKKQKVVADLSFEEFLIYKPKHYDINFFYTIFKFLKNSSFQNIPTMYLNDFFTLIDIFKYSKGRFNSYIHNKSEKLRPIFAKYIGDNIYKNTDFFHIINPWVNYSHLKSIFHIDDTMFLNLNLNYFVNSNIFEMTREINSILPGFTLFESIFIWYYFTETEDKELNNVFVFKHLPVMIIPSILKEIYKKHSIKISHYINIRDFNEYRKNNSIDNIITVENFTIPNNIVPIKNIFFPIPNYKKVIRA